MLQTFYLYKPPVDAATCLQQSLIEFLNMAILNVEKEIKLRLMKNKKPQVPKCPTRSIWETITQSYFVKNSTKSKL